jgi:hypothetical protein
VRTTDRRTARDRIRLVTTGVAVSGVVGVVAVAGGLAYGASHTDSQAGTDRTTSTPSDPGSKPATHRGHKQSAPPAGVSGGSAPAHAPSSGS